MLTVVDELEPEHPRNWNEAAASCISEILEQISRPLAHMQKEEENIKLNEEVTRIKDLMKKIL
jgi:hypothetical protein